MMKIRLIPLLFLSLLLFTGCKVEMNSSVSSGGVTWEVSQNGSFSSTSNYLGKETKVEIKTQDFYLTVNGEAYGVMEEGDEIKVEEGKVYRNDTEISPIAKPE